MALNSKSDNKMEERLQGLHLTPGPIPANTTQSPLARSHACTQCNTAVNVDSYCVQCKAALCNNCKTTHLRFEALSNHSIVPITEVGRKAIQRTIQYCPNHPAKPLQLNCIPCKLPICLQCKILDHDTHKTEDLQSALDKEFQELRSRATQLDTEQVKLHYARGQLNDVSEKVITMANQILKKINQTVEEYISRIMRDAEELKETVDTFVQSFTRKVNQKAEAINMSVMRIGSSQARISSLSSFGQESSALNAIRNELERMDSLFIECQQNSNVQEVLSEADHKPVLHKTALQTKNLLGTIEIQMSPQSRPEKEDITGKVKVQKCPGSFRHSEINLWQMTCEKSQTTFNLQRRYLRMCLHQDWLWLPCPSEDTIDIYSLTGQLLRPLSFPSGTAPQSLHPLTDTQLLLAARNGLHVYNTNLQALTHTIKRGEYKDVHANDKHAVALELCASNNRVHVFHSTDPPTPCSLFNLRHVDGRSVLIHGDCVYVSSWFKHNSICQFTIQGQLLRKLANEYGGPILFESPLLCAMNTDGYLLLNNLGSCRLQVMSPIGKFSQVRGVDTLQYLWDAIVVGDKMFVLHGTGTQSIQSYNIRQ